MLQPIINSWYPEPGVSPGPGGLPSTPLGAALIGVNDPPTVPPSATVKTTLEHTVTAADAPAGIEIGPNDVFLYPGGRAQQQDRAGRQRSTIATDYPSLLPLTRLYERLARDAIEDLDGAHPNEPEAIERNARQRELLSVLADGFAQIAAALEVFASDPSQPVLLGRAQVTVNSVAEQVTAWLKANAAEVTDWGMRLSIMAGAIATLGWAGANMAMATSMVGAMVGGDKVAKAIARRKK
jgi:hypothetical protein